MRFLRTNGWLIIVFALASFVMLWRLDAQPIVNFDEGIHGEVSWEMLAPRSSFHSFRAKEGSPTRPAKLQRSGEGEVGVERGDWVTPSYMNGQYFRKPPVKIWMTAGLFTVLPIETPPQDDGGRDRWITWALRLPSAVAGILTIVLTAWWAWEWLRSRWAAVLAGVIIATSPAIFEHAFRTGEMDGVLTFFVTVALYCWWKATRINDECRMTNVESPPEADAPLAQITNSEIRNSAFGFDSTFDIRPSSFRWLLASGAAIGLAVMTKSAAGLLPLPIIAMDYLLHRRWRTIPTRGILVLVLVLVLVVLPWHAAMTLLHGTAFWNEYLGFHVVRRITEQLHNAGAGPLWYFGAMRRIFSPWVWWLIAALFYEFILRRARARRRISRDGTRAPMSTGFRVSEILRPDPSVGTQDKLLGVLLIWLAVTFVGFSAAQTKFAWYLLPLLPAVAMLIAWFACVIIVPNIKKRPYTVLDDRPKLCTLARAVFVVLMLTTVGIAGAQTFRRLATEYSPSPFSAIATTLADQRADGLVAYGFAWQEQPAGYFTLRTSLPQVKVSDGLTDDTRTLKKLTERDRTWLITKTTELPEELRATVGVPHQIDGWSLWPRVAPQ